MAERADLASGPFQGVRVVEFGQFIAVPFCAQMLADGGAEVIKVEPIRGDPTRSSSPIIPGEGRQYLNKNRGKRSVAVELRHPLVRRAIGDLLDTADVVLLNFRPGIAEELGLDYPTVSTRNPRVIYAENSAFGNTGPLAGSAGMDVSMQAYSGIAHISESGPEVLGNPIVDYAAGMLLAWGISTALFAREKTGRGQRVDVALLQAALVLQNNTANHIDAVDSWREDFVRYQRDALTKGDSWRDILNERQRRSPFVTARAYYGFFRTEDGVIAVAAGSRQLQSRLLATLEIEDPWLSGAEIEDAVSHTEAIRQEVAQRLQSKPTAYWISHLRGLGIPCERHQTVDEILVDEQAWKNEFFVRLEHDLLGGLSVVGPPVKFTDTPLAVQKASPALGRHTREVLEEAGLSQAMIDDLCAEGAAKE